MHQFETTISEIINKSFNDAKPLGSNCDERTIGLGIAQWFNYCTKLKPLIFSYNNRHRKVLFQSFVLDPAFKPAAVNSIAMVINLTDEKKQLIQGFATFIVDMEKAHDDCRVLSVGKHDHQETALTSVTSAGCMLANDYSMLNRLIISQQDIGSKQHYDAKVIPELVFCNKEFNHVDELVEPFTSYLTRIIGSGIGVDFRKKMLMSVLKGYERTDCIQYVLVCNVGVGTSHDPVKMSDIDICSLKYRCMNRYKALIK